MNGQQVAVRSVQSTDLAWILALNKVHEEALSPLNAERLEELVEAAALVRVADAGAGFVICFDQTAEYDSPNFIWFRERYERFLYVDRIAVDATKGIAGVGKALYSAVAGAAADANYPLICAEVNTDPPNPGSLAFHAKQGFETVGEAHLPERGKSVRYLARPVG